MNAATSCRAAAKVLASLSPRQCRPRQPLPLPSTHLRPLTTINQRKQAQPTIPSKPSTTPRPTPTPAPTSTSTSPSQPTPTETVANDLSPSHDSNPLRTLETPLPSPLDPPPSTEPDWSRSFHGLSSTPFPPTAAATLQQPISTSDIEIKPDGIIYLPEIKYRRILNAAFGPGGWGLAPRGETIVTGKLVTREYGLVCHGRLVSVARGEQQYFDADGIPTATEGCKSNALMRCCKDLGIASELWDPRFVRKFLKEEGRECFVEHATTKKRRKHWMRKDDEIRWPFKEVTGGFGGGQTSGAAGGTQVKK